MYSVLLATLYESITNFFFVLGDLFTFDTLALMTVIALIAIVIIVVVATSFAIELKTSKAVEAVNNYLDKKPFVNEENLVEFNKLMKRIPKPMRYQWQQYMLNRQKAPSKFLTQKNCIEVPFKSSSYNQIIGYVKNIMAIIIIMTVLIGSSLTARPASESSGFLYEYVVSIGAIPGIFCLLGILFIIFLRARKRTTINDLYYNFDYMVASLDKAVETIPTFVDYEILFSKKEIKQGIPALQDYLEQRALYEQEEIERVKASIVDHDRYDFSELDINGSLVMDRAMRENEDYIGNRKRLSMEIEHLESERDSQARAFAEANKGLQRKLRDIKETLERLRDNLDHATNNIDSNYIRKQQIDEVKKQQGLEKEMATITNRFNKDVGTIEEEIAKRNNEIAQKRNYLEKAMNAEFGEYAKKAYDQLNELVEKRNKESFEKLTLEKEDIEKELDSNNALMVEKEVLYNEKLEAMSKLDKIVKKKDDEIALKEEYIKGQDARIRELEAGKVIQRFFDANGNEFFYDEEGNPFFKDESGNNIYYDGDMEEEGIETKVVEPVKKISKSTTTKKSTTKNTTKKTGTTKPKDTAK